MREKKIPISLSKNDYLYLNYIQQGLLYSGCPISSTLDFSDILKATVLYSMLSIYDWENHGIKTVKKFLIGLGIKDFKIPKTSEELLLVTKLNVTGSILKKYFEQLDNEHIGKKEEPYVVTPIANESVRDSGVSNFILKLKDEEIDLFDLLKTQLEILKKYADPTSKDSISYSEMTRILFRNIFIDVSKKNEYWNSVRLNLLSSFYIKGVYGFTALESILLMFHRVKIKNFPEMSKEGLGRLARIYSDETLLKIYLEDLKPRIFKIHTDFGPPKKVKLRGGVTRESFEIRSFSDNNDLDAKYISSVVPFVSFHSFFLGYVMLMMEWYLEQHKLPLLFSYFNSRNEWEVEFVQFHMVMAYESFQSPS